MDDSERQRAQSLTEYCTDFFLLGLQIRSGSVELPSAEMVKRRVLLLFESLKSSCHQSGVNPMDFEDIRYALAAYLDEVVQYADWNGKVEWARQPLQAMLFGEARAGSTFFQRLEQVRRRSKPALEIYYLCLVLGFQGELRLGTGQELDELTDDLRRELVPESSATISAHGKRPESAGLGGKNLPLVPLAGVLLIFSLGVVLLLYILLSSSTSGVLETLERMGRA